MTSDRPADRPSGRPADRTPPDAGEQRLAAELQSLGRALVTPVDADAITTAVLERLVHEPSPAAPSWWRPAWLSRLATEVRFRRRAVAAAIAGILLVLVLTPPVRATVADWLGLGILVRPGPAVPSASPPPAAIGDLTLEEAAALVPFTPVVPSALGDPDQIEVSADRRVVSMSWEPAGGDDGHGRLRLDEFDGAMAPRYVKEAMIDGVEYVDIDGRPALWFSEPHTVELLEDDGTIRTESARTTGPTLVWQRDDTVTLRLEGTGTVSEAVEIARSGVTGTR
jgi:hypothetical protein